MSQRKFEFATETCNLQLKNMKYCKQAIFEFTGNTSPVTSAQTQKPNKFTCNGAKSDFFRKLTLFRHIWDIFSRERTMKFTKNFQSSLAAYITQTQFTNFTTANKVVHQNSTNKIPSFSIKRQSSYQIPTDFHQKIILPYVHEIPHLPRLLPNFPPLSTFFFFRSDFAFTNIHDSQDCRGKGNLFL